MAKPPYTPENPSTVVINGVEIPNRLTFLEAWATNLERNVEILGMGGFDALNTKAAREAKALRDTIQLLEALGIQKVTDANSHP